MPASESSLKSEMLLYPWDGIVVHFHEIALRKGNRPQFLNALKRNIKRALNLQTDEIQKHWDRIFIRSTPETIASRMTILTSVFGIAYASPVKILPNELPVFLKEAVHLYRHLSKDGASFAVRVKRHEKSFPLSARQLEREIGAAVVQATSAPVNLSSPDLTLSFRIYSQKTHLLGEKRKGPAGLPLGTTGKVLTLLSGGIDSPVAAWLMMKRGCRTNFLHFYALRKAAEVEHSPVYKLVEQLLSPHRQSAQLILCPYLPFERACLTDPPPTGIELILFRRFMLRVAEQIALENHAQAIVTGDNLGQVASQTLENMTTTQEPVSIPIFRPLLTANKEEIIAQARRIQTYPLSIQPYKDCCSLLARHPKTKTKLESLHRAEAVWNIPALIEATLQEKKIVSIKFSG